MSDAKILSKIAKQGENTYDTDCDLKDIEIYQSIVYPMLLSIAKKGKNILTVQSTNPDFNNVDRVIYILKEKGFIVNKLPYSISILFV